MDFFSLTEAAVQAVTAPNYVLEESLSSQRLWKDTAGNRPPQPLEERAFFEQMWAQNFARSQVEYKMPVDVLTATTPISLSPFADGNFSEAGHPHGAPEVMSNYNLGVPTTGGGDGHSMGHGGSSGGGTDVAEATLVSRLNDPRGQNYINTPFFVQGIMGGAEPYEIVNRTVKSSDGDMTVLIKGDNVFGTTVSKSFARPGVSSGLIAGVDTVNISIASYRVVDVSLFNLFGCMCHNWLVLPFISISPYFILFTVVSNSLPTHSLKSMASTLNSLLYIERGVSVIRSEFGNVILTSKT
jgi:hypothetical protein